MKSTVTLYLRAPESVAERLKSQAAAQGLSVNELAVRILGNGLEPDGGGEHAERGTQEGR